MGEEQNSDKVRSDLVFLMQCFKEVLIELKEDELAKNLPWLEENLHPTNVDNIESNFPLRN